MDMCYFYTDSHFATALSLFQTRFHSRLNAKTITQQRETFTEEIVPSITYSAFPIGGLSLIRSTREIWVNEAIADTKLLSLEILSFLTEVSDVVNKSSKF